MSEDHPKRRPLVTVFSIPKPFAGNSELIQRNAIKSWLSIQPGVEIILIGDDKGTAEAAREFKTAHIPNVERNQFNTPTVSSAFEKAQHAATGTVMAYVNADIILTSDIFRPLESIPFKEYLISAKRWDLEVKRELDFQSADWEIQLSKEIASRGQLHAATGMDLFMFPRGMCRDMPPFGIGRANWDSWFVYWARSNGIPVVNATESVRIIHQNHDYSHLPQGWAGAHRGPEAELNLHLAGGNDYVFNLDDADWIFSSAGFRKAPLTPRTLLRRLRALPALHPRVSPIMRPVFNLARALFRRRVN